MQRRATASFLALVSWILMIPGAPGAEVAVDPIVSTGGFDCRITLIHPSAIPQTAKTDCEGAHVGGSTGVGSDARVGVAAGDAMWLYHIAYSDVCIADEASFAGSAVGEVAFRYSGVLSGSTVHGSFGYTRVGLTFVMFLSDLHVHPGELGPEHTGGSGSGVGVAAGAFVPTLPLSTCATPDPQQQVRLLGTYLGL